MSHVEEYENIMQQYRDRKFGDELLSMKQILDKAGRPTLFDEMSLEEVTYLLDKTNGIPKAMFAKLKTEKEKAAS